MCFFLYDRLNYVYQKLKQMSQASVPPIARWSKPGFLSKKKPEMFGISHRPDANVPINLQLGDAQLRWEDGCWKNLNFDTQPANANPTSQEIFEIQRENAQLRVECEILLHMLTVSEMKKTRAQETLSDLKIRISKLVELAESQQGEQKQ